MGEEDIERIMKHELVMVGTDGSGISPKGVLGHGKPHPRYYGTYPRILGKYVRERGLLTLEEAIYKMSGFPAKRLGLSDRGTLEVGNWADIVVFNQDIVIDRATYANPHQYPEGIEKVIVNVKLVIENEEHTGNLPGKVLRHKT